MRIDINLASHPYEDAGPLWLRWGGALAAVAVLTLILLYSALSGWASARSDRNLIEQREQQIAARDQQKVKAEETLNLPANRGTRDRARKMSRAQSRAFSRKWTAWQRRQLLGPVEQFFGPGADSSERNSDFTLDRLPPRGRTRGLAT